MCAILYTLFLCFYLFIVYWWFYNNIQYCTSIMIKVYYFSIVLFKLLNVNKYNISLTKWVILEQSLICSKRQEYMIPSPENYKCLYISLPAITINPICPTLNITNLIPIWLIFHPRSQIWHCTSVGVMVN